MTTTKKKKIINSCREEVVKSIARETAEFITIKAVEESQNVEESVEVMHDVVRHLMKKLGAERRKR